MVPVNAWLIYRRNADELGIPKQRQLSSFKFRHSVANALALEKKTVVAIKKILEEVV